MESNKKLEEILRFAAGSYEVEIPTAADYKALAKEVSRYNRRYTSAFGREVVPIALGSWDWISRKVVVRIADHERIGTTGARVGSIRYRLERLAAGEVLRIPFSEEKIESVRSIAYGLGRGKFRVVPDAGFTVVERADREVGGVSLRAKVFEACRAGGGRFEGAAPQSVRLYVTSFNNENGTKLRVRVDRRGEAEIYRGDRVEDLPEAARFLAEIALRASDGRGASEEEIARFKAIARKVVEDVSPPDWVR